MGAKADGGAAAPGEGRPGQDGRTPWLSLSLICLAVLFVSLAAGLLVPVYTDEVTSRFQLARAPFDGGFDRFVAEACGPNTIARPPFFMLPFRWFSAYANLAFDSPAWVRTAGVLGAFAWVAMVWRLVGQTAGSLTPCLRAFALAICGLGVLPFLLIWSRPEQALLLTITLVLIVATRRPAATEARGAWLAAALVLLSGLAALSYHLKGVVFLPVFMAAAALSSQGKPGRPARWASVALLAGAGAVALRYWTNRFSCPADPILFEQLGRQNIGAMFLAYGKHDLGDLAHAVLKNVSPLEYVKVALPARAYMSDWLPPVESLLPILKAWRLSIRISWVVALALIAGGFAVSLGSAVKARRLAPPLLLGLAVLAVALLWSASQMVKNAYEATIVLPLLLLAGLLVLGSASLGNWSRRTLGAGVIGVAVVSIASQGLMLTEYGPRLWATAQRPGYIQSQPFSLAPWGYGSLAPKIVAAGRLCGLKPEDRPKGLLIDDLTYFEFMRAYRPQHRLGVLSTWNGAQRDPLAYLQSKQSEGAVVGCRFLPADLRARARAVDDFCCLPLP